MKIDPFLFSLLRVRSFPISLALARTCNKTFSVANPVSVSVAISAAKPVTKDNNEESNEAEEEEEEDDGGGEQGGYRICRNLIFREATNSPLRREIFQLKKKKRKKKKKKKIIFLHVLTISLSAIGIGIGIGVGTRTEIEPLSKERAVGDQSIFLLFNENMDRVAKTEASSLLLWESKNSVNAKGEIEPVSQKGGSKKKPAFPISLQASSSSSFSSDPLLPRNENGLDFDNKINLWNPGKVHHDKSLLQLENSVSLFGIENSIYFDNMVETISPKGGSEKNPIFPISLYASSCNPLLPKNKNALNFENKIKLLNPGKNHCNNLVFPLETSALLSNSDNSLNFENAIEPILRKGSGKKKPIFPIALQASSNPLLPKNENALNFKNKLKSSNLEKTHHNRLVFLPETSASVSNSENSPDTEDAIEPVSQKGGSKKKIISPISLQVSSNPLLPKNENSLDFENKFKPLNLEKTHHNISVFVPETSASLSNSENSVNFENTIKPTLQIGAARKKPTFLEISDLPLQRGENSLHKTGKPLSPRKEEFQHKSLFREVSSLKRRRPTRLSISLSSDLIKTPSGLLPPNEVKTKDMGEKNIQIEGPNYGVVCRQGQRQIMEDMHAATSIHCGDSKQDFFAICDGHGGRDAAEFVARNLPQNIAKALSASSQVMEKEEKEEEEEEEDAVKMAISSSYLATDHQFLQQQVGSGASCVSVVVQKKSLIVANAGDCRAVLSRAGKAEALSRDHRAEREDERRRIEKMGGYVDCFNGVWRVQGTLAVTRGFGDSHLKEWISPEPEINMLSLESNCEFLILASDGLWDKVSNEEAVECARVSLNEKEVDGRVASACKRLVDMATRRGSLDDISVMIIDLEVYLRS